MVVAGPRLGIAVDRQAVAVPLEFRQEIDAALAGTRRRTLRHVLEGQSVWVKRPRRGPGYLRYALQVSVAAMLQIAALRPPKVSRGGPGLHGEARRLTRLRRKGWQVPSVLAVSERWLVLTDNGPSIALALREMPAGARLRYLRDVLAYLQALHAGGGWHGAAQVRNFTKVDSGFGLIDFEDDVEPAMPLPVRQARDILLFVMSAGRHVGNDHLDLKALLADARDRASSSVAAELRDVGDKLISAHRVLGPIARWTGPDGRSIALLAQAFRALRPASSAAPEIATQPVHKSR